MRPGRVPWRGVAQEGSAQLVIALPVLAGTVICPRVRRHGDGQGGHRGRPAQAAGDDRGPGQPGDPAGRRPVRYRRGQLPSAAAGRAAVARAGLGGGRRERDRPPPHPAAAGQRERVLDVPAKLAARARVFDTGQGRKTDATDAHAIVMAALRDKGLREVSTDPGLMVLRMLCDRRDELSRARAQALNRMHRLFLGLLPGGAPVKKSVSQYQAMLATVRPRDLAGKTCRRMAAGELEDLHRLDAKLKSMKAGLKAAVPATGSHLMDIHGIGPAGPPGSSRLRLARSPPHSVLHRPDRRLQRPASAPPALARRQPPAQPCALYGRHRPAAQRHRGPGLLPAQARHRQHLDGGDALPAPPALRRGLPAAGRRRCRPGRSEPGRAPRGVSRIQRGLPVPGHRPFGSATSRTRTPDATATTPGSTAHGPRSRCHPAARPR